MRYISKKFLSKNFYEGGSIIAQVESDRPEDISDYTIEHPSVEANLCFRACHGEPITLDFTIRSDKSLQERIEKIDVLIHEMKEFRENFEQAWNTLKQDIEVRVNEDKTGA